MSKDERKVESVLLQEHWKLIQQGTNHKHISIRKNEIFVGKLLHAKVVDQKLAQCRSQAVSTDNVSSLSNSVETEMDQATPWLASCNYSLVHSRLNNDCNSIDYEHTNYDKMTLVIANFCSAYNKEAELDAFLSSNDIDILLGTESHLDDSIFNSEIFPDF